MRRDEGQEARIGWSAQNGETISTSSRADNPARPTEMGRIAQRCNTLSVVSPGGRAELERGDARQSSGGIFGQKTMAHRDASERRSSPR